LDKKRSFVLPSSPLSVGIMLASFACFYAIELTTLPLSIDDELAAGRIDPTVWVAQGRWTTYVVEALLMPTPVLPFVPIAVFGLCLVLSYLFVLKVVRCNPDAPVALLTFPLFAAFPTWSFITEFQANTPAIGIGVLAICIALDHFKPILNNRLLEGRAGFSFAASIIVTSLCIAVAIGAYQTLFLFFVVLGFASIIINAIDDSEISSWSALRSMIILTFVVGLGIGFYSIIIAVFRVGLGVEISYIDNFLNFPLLLDQPAAVLLFTLESARMVYFGSSDVYGLSAWSFGMLIFVSFLAILFTPKLRKRRALRIVLILMNAVMLLTPFAFNLITGGVLPIRSLLGVPPAIWACAYLAITAPVAWLSRTSLMLAAFSIFQVLASVYLQQTKSILVRQHDAATANAIYQKIAEAQPRWERSTIYPIAVYGGWPFDSPYKKVVTSTAGASFFEWGGGNPYRIVSFMKLLGYGNITVAPDSWLDDAARDVARAMPVWPASGSVKSVGEFTIIKLGDID
jgi:hypothetical protein